VRVLFLTIGPECEPSSRFRAYQYVEPLARAGVCAQVRPRVGRAYFEMGYGLRRTAAPARAAWAAGSFGWRSLRRLRDLWQARDFDVLVMQKETLPFGMERLLTRWGIPVVFDFDDAIYEPSPQRAGDGLGPLLGGLAERVARRERALPALLARCRAVLAGSEVLAEYARRHSRHVHVLPTVVDTDVYPLRDARRSGRLTLGWIGAPAGSAYLEPLRPVFQALARRFDFRLLLLGAQAFECPGVRVELGAWRFYRSRREEAAHLSELDVGLMPLPDDRWAAGKCALKAIQYMASGIPVVASPVGAARDVVRDGECGYLAGDPASWQARLAALLADPALRASLGRAGRARAEAHYSLRAAVPRLLRVLEEAAGHSSRRAPSRMQRERVRRFAAQPLAPPPAT
jgi:glycosyltransferase involved in cell wall biosynthesis